MLTECILQVIVLYYLIRVYFVHKSKSWLAFIFAFILIISQSLLRINRIYEAGYTDKLLPSFEYLLISICISALFLIGIKTLKKRFKTSEENFVHSQMEFKEFKTFMDNVNEQYATAIESAGVGVWDWDILKNEYKWNEQMFILWELEKNESMEINLISLRNKMFPEDSLKSQTELQLALEGKEEYNSELRYYTKDGSIRYTQAVGKIFRDKSGLPIRMIGVNLDITNSKTKEDLLNRSEQKWKSLVEAIPDYVSIYDIDGKFLFLNHFAEGFSQKDLYGKYYYDFLSEESALKMKDAFQKAITTKQIQFLEHTGFGDNQSIRHYNNYMVPIIKNDNIENILVISRDITEQIEAEKKLLESRERFDSALASMTDAVFISDEKGHFTDFNQAFITFHRFKSREECARSLDEYPKFLEVYEVNGELTPFERWAVPRALRGETAINVEHILKRTDTNETWIGSYSLAPIRNLEGAIIGSVVTARDITEFKEIQKSILENERLLQMAYEATDLGIIRRDLKHGDILLLNDRAQAHCGVKQKEMPTTEVINKIHPDDLIILKQKMEESRLSINNGKYAFEYRILHEDGEYHWVAIEAQYFFEGEGNQRYPVSTLTTTRNITSRKKLEQEVLEKNKLLEMAYEAADMGVWKHDMLSDIFYFNERSQLHHGFTKAQITIEELRSIIHPEDLAKVGDLFLKAIGEEGNGRYSQQLRILNKEKGIRWLSIDAFIKMEGEGEKRHPIFSIGTSRDITEQKNAELELEKYRNQLEQLVEDRTQQLTESLEQIKAINQNLTQKEIEVNAINKELEAFSYSVSHDLRTPLRSIDGFSNLISKKYSNLLPEEGQDYFKRIRNASQKMGILIDDILRLSRISRSQVNRENVNLSELAISISNDLITLDPDRIGDFIIKADINAVVDKNLMQVALQNLLGNAWKYTRYKEKTRIEFGTFSKDNMTIYFIRDNGVGFDMKYSNKLFGAFQRLHNSSEFEGTGIGLATTLRVINKHGGQIWTEAEVDNGATFYFTV